VQVVPGHGSEHISVVFSPSAITVPLDAVDCQSFGLGYLTLRESEQNVKGRVHRPHQYDLQPLDVRMTARVMRASLAVEYHDDDAMKYVIPAGDLLDDSNQVRRRLPLPLK